MITKQLMNVKKEKPLIQNITNYVTVNDCANILLACGGSPIMSDYVGEAEEIAAICNGLNINMGTLNPDTVATMLAAGKKCNQIAHPVVLDPVGVGASAWRTKAAGILLHELQFTVIRGNISEIKTLEFGEGTTKGVDADEADAVTSDNLQESIKEAKELARKTGAVIAISGATDIVADGEHAYIIKNGHPLMSKVTGTGCMLSALTAAYVAANTKTPLEAAAAATIAMGICGEIAAERMQEKDGNTAYRGYLIDAIYNLDEETMERRANYEVR